MDTTDMSSTTREESELAQESGAQHFHEPHPEFWQPIQGIGRSSREQDCRRDGVGWVLHRRSCRNTAELLGLRPREYWPKYSYCWKRCLHFGTCEECVGEPRLRHLRPAIGPTTISKNEQLRLDAATMVVGSLVMGTSSEWPGARCA